MLPKDPHMLASFLNTKLRDFYPSLDALCEDLDVDRQEIVDRLAAEDYTYSWVIDVDDVIVGTIGAYDYTEGAACEGGESGAQSTDGATGDDGAAESRIEVGLTIAQDWRGRGFAAEALACVLHHLTENEGIDCVTAWCAADNIGSWKAMEKAGMQRVTTEKDGLVVGDRTYDKLVYEYHVKKNI
jgi:RimJ/RimL family protein N-acetyltransferase